MIDKLKLTFIALLCVSMMGCMYRADGIFKGIGKSDYKARINFMDLFAVADGRLTYVSGAVTLEDRVTPAKNARIVLKKKEDGRALANAVTDNVGRFWLSAQLVDGNCVLEITANDHTKEEDIFVKPGEGHWVEVTAGAK